MLNSSLLKAMHVVDSFQNSILADYPELSSQVGDHLVSFDGTLTTIYEGEDAISPETRIEAPRAEDGAKGGGIGKGAVLSAEKATQASGAIADLDALLRSQAEPTNGMLTEAVAETSGGTGGPTSHESILGGLDVSRIVATIQRLTANTEESKAQLEDYKNKSALPEG